jgi:hypothetical protein
MKSEFSFNFCNQKVKLGLSSLSCLKFKFWFRKNQNAEYRIVKNIVLFGIQGLKNEFTFKILNKAKILILKYRKFI